MWVASTLSGHGAVFDDDSDAWVNCSFKVLDGLTITVGQPALPGQLSRKHTFIVKMSLKATSVSSCDAGTEVVSTSYSGITLEQTVTVVTKAGVTTACVKLDGSPLLPVEARDGYVGLRKRAHVRARATPAGLRPLEASCVFSFCVFSICVL
jgi:hypothetical protein